MQSVWLSREPPHSCISSAEQPGSIGGDGGGDGDSLQNASSSRRVQFLAAGPTLATQSSHARAPSSLAWRQASAARQPAAGRDAPRRQSRSAAGGGGNDGSEA